MGTSEEPRKQRVKWHRHDGQRGHSALMGCPHPTHEPHPACPAPGDPRKDARGLLEPGLLSYSVVQHRPGEIERRAKRAGAVKSEGRKGNGVWGGAEGDRARRGVLSAREGVAVQFRDTCLARKHARTQNYSHRPRNELLLLHYARGLALQ